MIIEKSMIIAVAAERYIDFPGRPWSEHFVPSRKLLLVKTEPSNNGNMLCVDARGKLQHVNALEVIEIVQKKSKEV